MESSEQSKDLSRRANFVAWLFLPIGMKLNEDLVIKGRGTHSTINNAREMSYVWQSWLPGHFSTVDIEFERIERIKTSNKRDGNLMLYSGGVDSTYSISQRVKQGYSQDLLTIQGMDYNLDDDEKFQKLLEKTNDFVEEYGDRRITLRSDASDLYGEIGVNPSGHHLSHIFNLSSALFLHSNYKNYYIASDFPPHHQFIAHPWGSNSITNKLFSDGYRQLYTLDDDVERSDKVKSLLEDNLTSTTTFCKTYESRPDNCGICSKCVRTKSMFLAQKGKHPDVFEDSTISERWFEIIADPCDRSYLSEIIYKAKRNQTESVLPNFSEAEKKLEESQAYAKNRQPIPDSDLKRHIYARLPYPIDQLGKSIYQKYKHD